jgi:menaquinone-dependent protoporphyrinogen IX oxidase
MKTIVLYYSRKGSNQFLAKKIAKTLNCEIVEIKPRLDLHFFMLLGLNFGNRKLKIDPTLYDQIILCGPIWMGKFIIPLKNFTEKYKDEIKKLVFVTCCGSTFEMKDDKFGHGTVFKKVKSILNEKLTHCQAFPITLVIPDNKKDDGNVVMSTRLTSDNFNGQILDIFNKFIKKVSV